MEDLLTAVYRSVLVSMLAERSVLAQRANRCRIILSCSYTSPPDPLTRCRFLLSLATADLGLAVLVMSPSLLTDTARLGAGRCRAWVTADVVLSTASIYRCIQCYTVRFYADRDTSGVYYLHTYSRPFQKCM